MSGDADDMFCGVLFTVLECALREFNAMLCFLCRTDGDRSYSPGVDLYIRCYWKCNGKF